MGATNEFLARVPRRADGKRDWPSELKAHMRHWVLLISGHTSIIAPDSVSVMRLQLTLTEQVGLLSLHIGF